jgi:NADH-quinone oxidoreductase subunit L
MVVAGVYLVARLYPVFWEGFSIPDLNANMIVVVAAITIVISALLAFVQDDIKKVLAYSTVGQLGYMMLGLGSGAWLPAVFHIFTHAFFKCCLFLCAGSVSHSASHHSFDMKKDMGGLWRKMPVTFGAWTVSALALAGIFPFAGFFSKDEIIDNVGHNGYSVFMWISLIGAFMTAAYTVRATYLTFFGEPRGAAAGIHHEVHTEAHAVATEDAHGLPAHDVYQEPELQDTEHGDAHAGPHESPKLLLVPLCILAVFAFGVGWTNAALLPEEYHKFAEYVEPNVAHEEAAAEGEHAEAAAPPSEETTATTGEITTFPPVSHAEIQWWPNAATSLIIVGAGLLSAWVFCVAFYGRRDRRLVGLTQRVPPLRWGYTFVANKYYLDALYEGVIVHAIAHPIAKAAYWVNQHVIDGIVNGAGELGKRIGAWTYRWVDQGVVDGTVNGTGVIAEETGEALRPVQSGRINQYGALLFGAATVGAIVLVIINV